MADWRERSASNAVACEDGFPRTQCAGAKHSYDKNFHGDHPHAFPAVNVHLDIVSREAFAVRHLLRHDCLIDDCLVLRSKLGNFKVFFTGLPGVNGS